MKNFVKVIGFMILFVLCASVVFAADIDMNLTTGDSTSNNRISY